MVNTHSSSPCSSHPSDPNGFASDEDPSEKNDVVREGGEEGQDFGGSCPDLSEDQLQKWDDYLYEKATENGNHEKSAMSGSIYEVVPRCLLDVAEQTVDGITSEHVRRLDKEINGNVMTSSAVMERLANHRLDSDATTEKTLAEEMGQLEFRPTLSKYGYPQVDAPRVHMATWGQTDKKVKTSLIDRDALKKYLDEEDDHEEDFLEGLNITVNKFDACDDLTLSDVESPPSRFEQIHRAIKENTQNYDLRAPERVCCILM